MSVRTNEMLERPLLSHLASPSRQKTTTNKACDYLERHILIDGQRSVTAIAPKLLAVAWLIDALLGLQPANLGRQLWFSIGENSMGEPPLIRRLVLTTGQFASRHGLAFGLSVAGIQLLIAFGIWGPRTRKYALSFSIVWALCIWGAGEAFGGLWSHFAMMPSGAPGPALLYAIAAGLVLSKGRGAKVVWLALMSGALVTQLMASTGGIGFKLGANETMTSLGEPSQLARLDRTLGAYASQHGLSVALGLGLLEFLMLATPFTKGRALAPCIVLSWVVCATFWGLGENFGTLATGTASDIGSAPLYGLLVWFAACQEGRGLLTQRLARVPSRSWTSLLALRSSGAAAHVATSSTLPMKRTHSRGARAALASPRHEKMVPSRSLSKARDAQSWV